MQKIKILPLLMACILCLTGCWDKIEVEDRAFVLVMGIDKASPEDIAAGNIYKISLVNPDTAKSEEGKVLDFVTYDTIAPSYSIGVVQLLQRFSKNHSYEHTKVLIFGRELMEDPTLLKNIFDAFSRGHQFNSSMLIYMTMGEASEVFKTKPKMKSLLATYITGIADNEIYASRIGKETYLQFTRQMADNQGDGVMPHIIPSEDELKVAHLGIFKDYKHIGHLNEKETVAYKWLNDEAKGGVIDLSNPSYAAPYTYYFFKRKIYLDKVEGGKIYLTYDMETEGAIEEYIMGSKLLDEEKLKALEGDLEKIIVKDCKDLIKKMQEEYKVDLLGVRNYLSKHHPSLYETVEKDFKEYFERNVVIDVKADVKVRRIGKVE